MALQIYDNKTVSMRIPTQHRRVHFHVRGETFNIHEYMMERVAQVWPPEDEECCLDEKSERHYEDKYLPTWIYRAIVLWLYKGHFPDRETLAQWMGEIPKDWTSGSEKDPLACSLAIHLHVETYAKGWFGFADVMITFLFKEYQEQCLPPSSAKLRQVFFGDMRNEVNGLFVALHDKFYDPDVVKCTIDEQSRELRQYPLKFFHELFLYRGTRERFADQLHPENDEDMTSEGVRTHFKGSPPLRLVDYHYHFTNIGDTGSKCAACNTAELRAAFTVPQV